MTNDAPPDSGAQPGDDAQAEFIRLLQAHQRKLLGYLAALVGCRQDAEDVLQRASVTMWRKFGTFARGTDFMAWATTVAFYEARNFLRVAGRSRLTFDAALLDLLAQERARDVAQQDPRLEALEHCVQQLDPPARDLVREAYLDGADIATLAARLGRAPQTLYNKLHLLRKALAECIERRLAEGGAS